MGNTIAVQPAASDDSAAPIARGRAGWRPRWDLFTVAIGWLLLMVAVAALADILPIADYSVRVGEPRTPPSLVAEEWLGTDTLGRSMLSRIIYGTRVSLVVGFCAVLIGLIVGGSAGVIAGYFRGRVDAAISMIINSMLAFPALLLLLAVTAVLRPSLATLVVCLGIITTPPFARLARANTLAHAQQEFVLAARAMGATHLRVLFREILPNVALPVSSYAFLVTAVAVVAEGSLSFLGMGIPPPQPSWGGMISAGRSFLSTDPYLVLVPSVAMLTAVLALNVVGDHVRRQVQGAHSVL